MKRCETCGGSLEGRRSVARYCSDLCRVRGKRGYRAPTLTEATIAPAHPAEASDPPASELMSLEDVARELQATLRSPLTPPTAKAPLAREYLATLEKIRAELPPVRDGVDELLGRRVHRTGS